MQLPVLYAADTIQASTNSVVELAKKQKGLILLLECKDTELMKKLTSLKGAIVENVRSDSKYIGKTPAVAGIYESQWNGTQIPSIANNVNLLVVSDKVDVKESEILRVLVPGGVALHKGKKLIKPLDTATDEWTHYLHGPDNNSVSRDTKISYPSGLQWIDHPKWTRDHDATPVISCQVSAQGRVFYVFDEGPIAVIDSRVPTKPKVIARDAYNGVKLWEYNLPDWYPSDMQWGTVPVSVNRRLVAVGDKVYVTDGFKGAVIALDAATGKKVATFKGSEDASELLVAGGCLVVGTSSQKINPKNAYPENRSQKFNRASLHSTGAGGQIAVYDVATGNELWRHKVDYVSTLTASDGERLLYAEDKHLKCVDLKQGKTLWKAPTCLKLVMRDGVVVTATRQRNNINVIAYSIADGKQLWEQAGRSLPIFAKFYIPPEIFIANGQVWLQPQKDNAIIGHDLKTGKQTKSISLEGALTEGHHVRCYPAKATDNFLLLNKRGIEYVDLLGDDGVIKHDWVRGQCRMGIMPANGMTYIPPHGCNCSIESYVRGLHAMNSEPIPAPIDDSQRLMKGPAYGAALAQSDTTDTQWPAYRHNSARTSGRDTTIKHNLTFKWTKEFDGALSSVTASGNLTFVSDKESRYVHALNVSNGKPVWKFYAGARVDSPPTYSAGLVVFGAADGFVYCLNATNGELVWRFQAALADHRHVAFGQLQSLWPCHGSVLIMDNIVYASAGQSSFLDGGIALYALDLKSGKILHKNLIKTKQIQNTTKMDTYNSRGALSDILVSDGEYIFMRQLKFDLKLKQLSKFHPYEKGNEASAPRVQASSGFLDHAGNKRAFQGVSDSWLGRYSSLRAQQVAVNGGIIFGSRVHYERGWKSPRYHVGDGTHVFALDPFKAPEYMKKEAEYYKKGSLGGLKGGFRRQNKKYLEWEKQIPVYAKASVVAGDKLLIAGRPDRTVDDTIALTKNQAKGELWILSNKTGEVLNTIELPSPPQKDGMCIVGDSVIINSGNKLFCLTGEVSK